MKDSSAKYPIAKHSSVIGSILLAVAMLLAGRGMLALGQTGPGSPPPPGSPPTGAVLLDSDDLEQLVTPIALYPDPLLAQVLPASTYPLEIQSASNFLAANPDPSEAAIDAQALEPSIKALLHYPAVLQMMTDQIDWTQQLGIAFVNQQADVMGAIQRVRARAMAAGALVSGPQMQVTSDEDGIQIMPTDPNMLYVPQYDPDAVYIGDDGLESYITWGSGYPCGIWLDNGIDWHNRWVGIGDGWNHGWGRPHGARLPDLHRWERNGAQPLPVARPEAPGRLVRPGYENPQVVRPEPGAFNGYERSPQVQRSEGQFQQSRPLPPPAPRAPQPVFRAEGNGRAVEAQSERGHASMAPQGGGERGGGGGGGGGGRR
jgi:hypothetical protein